MTDEGKAPQFSEILARLKKLNLEKLADSFDQFEDIAGKFLPGLMPTEALVKQAADLIVEFGEPAQNAISELLCGPDSTLRDFIKGELDKDAKKAALALVPPLIKQFTLDPAAALKVAGFIVGALISKADDDLCKSLAGKGLTGAAPAKPQVKPAPPAKPKKDTAKPKKESTAKPKKESTAKPSGKPPKTSAASKPKTESKPTKPKTSASSTKPADDEKPDRKTTETKPKKTATSSNKTTKAEKTDKKSSTAKPAKPKKTTKAKADDQSPTATTAKPKTPKKPKAAQSPKK